MRVGFLQVAEDELAEAIAYYNLQSEGLGLEFAAEARRALGRMLMYPAAWTSVSRRTRRCRLNRFPYALLYQPRCDSLLIVAVQNLHRDPDSWKSRLGPGKA